MYGRWALVSFPTTLRKNKINENEKELKNSQQQIHPLSFRSMESRNVDCCGGRKTGELSEKPLDKGREPTTT